MTKTHGGRLRNRGRLLLCATLAALGMGSAVAQTQMGFQLLAGGWTGDGGQAKAANLHGVSDVAFDKNGNLFVAQYNGNRIRKITPAGVITTVAGGNTGFAGDGGPASKALISHPSALAFDAAGNLYFTDVGNRRVRRIAVDGTISTIAGNGSWVSSGDGGKAVNAGFRMPNAVAVDKTGNVFVSDFLAHVVRKITPTGVISRYAGNGQGSFSGNNGPATAAQLWGPSGVALDAAGNLYIADTYNNAVRRVSTSGIITTFKNVDAPDGLAIDASGAVYVGAICNMYKFVGSTGTTFGDGMCARSPEGASAATAAFGYVPGLTVTATGDIYYADPDSARIARITAANGLVSTYAGARLDQVDGAAALSGTMRVTNALAVDNAGNVLISERTAHRVRKVSAGKLYNFAGNGDTGTSTCSAPCSASSFYLLSLSGVATTAAGHVFVADRGSRRVFSVKDGTLTVFAGGGTDEGEGVPATSIGMFPRGIATDSADNLYIADFDSARIRKVDPAGIVRTIAGNGETAGIGDDPTADAGDGGLATSAKVSFPSSVSVDSDGNVFFFEDSRGVIRKIGTDGIIRRIAGRTDLDVSYAGGFTGEGGPALSAHLGVVTGLVAHSSGVYFASECALRRVTPTGKVETIAGYPYCAIGLAIKGRFLYVSSDSGRITRALLPRITPNDFNGDRRSDVVWRTAAGADVLWLSANSATRQSIAAAPAQMKLVGQGDFDADGKSDLVWRDTSTGKNVIWRAGNVNTTLGVSTIADQAWTIAGVGDFNGDGKSDLFWRNKNTGVQEVWYSGSSATRLGVAKLADMQWVFSGVGDFDGDGKSDLLWRNTVTGGNSIWRSANASTARPTAALATAWKIATIADFNGDGASDILWRDQATGANTIWKSGSNAKVQGVVGVTNLDWKVAAAGDYDNDGRADILWRDMRTGANTLWLNAVNATQRAVPTVGIAWSVQPNEAQP